MTLPQGMRALLAYFPSSTKAQAAMEELKSMGISDVSLDRVSRYGTTTNAALNNPRNDAQSITGLTLFSNNSLSSDASVLQAADPAVSGMASRGYGLAGGHAFLVTAVTTDEMGERAARVLEKHGGSL
ncbi:hypothetical protein Desca_0597 [Desulfotomaculum nigrificans CO-1-SRB]|uniref:Uncharacterized protein n=1 Tax=Desulfotomaculum nigrificans (strain DSM 14880 / VKM B-2319 / CO-1-SRB) TaxID=868595 RepID=F6B842_DESCC|nr:hypothetical protein [Desulfotomaculum nigrificans]AEF93487.1 hypothetical protein Desca_0597 [Desulfotomaculum nigrificans CO-1-SRB]